ncbi:MAG: hypothetical protein LBQ18_06575 [Campylobacteraceae bacterium]|jgi:acetyltransferase-like isoleucine patch superfamily enzyme|nr:hypothetical protein [Campylobacteraceae bacterium]
MSNSEQITIINKLKKLFVNILCAFVPKKEWRHRLRSKPNKPLNNKIIIVKDGKEHTVKNYSCIKGLNLVITGSNNTVKFYLPIIIQNSKIYITSNDTYVEIQSSSRLCNVDIYCGYGYHQICKIGRQTTIEQAKITIDDKNTGLIIGEDCMISVGIIIRAADGHTVLDRKTNNILNHPQGLVTIGDHCWIGQNVNLTKNAKLPNNTIVGMAAVVTKSFTEEYTAIAGNPAKVVKRDVTWDRKAIWQLE